MPECCYLAGRAGSLWSGSYGCSSVICIWMGLCGRSRSCLFSTRRLLPQCQPCSPQVCFVYVPFKATVRQTPPPPTTSGRFKNCFLYLGNGPVAMPWMLLLIYRGHRMKEPSGNVLIINLFHTLIKDSWQPLVFAAAVQQDAGELRLKRLPGI